MQIGHPQQPEPPDATPPPPQWTPSIGGSLCPQGHFVKLFAKYCPTCGAGPISGSVEWESQDRTSRLGAKGPF
jgi:hypothetical protein